MGGILKAATTHPCPSGRRASPKGCSFRPRSINSSIVLVGGKLVALLNYVFHVKIYNPHQGNKKQRSFLIIILKEE